MSTFTEGVLNHLQEITDILSFLKLYPEITNRVKRISDQETLFWDLHIVKSLQSFTLTDPDILIKLLTTISHEYFREIRENPGKYNEETYLVRSRGDPNRDDIMFNFSNNGFVTRIYWNISGYTNTGLLQYPFRSVLYQNLNLILNMICWKLSDSNFELFPHESPRVETLNPQNLSRCDFVDLEDAIIDNFKIDIVRKVCPLKEQTVEEVISYCIHIYNDIDPHSLFERVSTMIKHPDLKKVYRKVIGNVIDSIQRNYR